MDNLNPNRIINVKSIKTWKELNSNVKENIFENTFNENNIIFPNIPSLNEKIAIWNGNLLHIRSQCIVLTINDLLDSKIAVNTASISKIGGSKYVEDFINLVLGCRTGEIRVTEGHDLSCQYVLHTVCPRFNPKYESAATNALYNCYRNALMTSIEKGLRVITFAPLHISKYTFPNSLGIHIASRTIRRFLEKYSDHIDLIILQVTEDLYSTYEEVMQIYFPRNLVEEQFSFSNVPKDLGNEDGQPIQPNREIRISAFPYGPKTRRSDSDENSDDYSNKRSSIDITKSAKHSLTKSQIAPAVLRQSFASKVEGGLATTLKHFEQSLTIERKFDRLLRISKKMDFTLLTEKRIFYQCGKDMHERPLLLVVERNIPNDIETRKKEIFAFIIWTLEKFAKGSEFIIIYAHTQSNYHPSRTMLTEIVELLNFRYYKNLQYMCMIHPTLLNRGSNWIFSTFNAPEIKSKMITVTNLRQLYRIVNPNMLELPDFIYDHDKQVGGNNVYNDSVFIRDQHSEQQERKPSVTNPSSADYQL